MDKDCFLSLTLVLNKIKLITDQYISEKVLIKQVLEQVLKILGEQKLLISSAIYITTNE